MLRSKLVLLLTEIIQYLSCLRNTTSFIPPRYRNARGTSHYTTLSEWYLFPAVSKNIDYVDCILCSEVRPNRVKMGVVSMKLNYIQWWGFTFETLRKVELPFLTITLRSTLTQSANTYLLIYGSNICLWTLFVFDRKTRNHVIEHYLRFTSL